MGIILYPLIFLFLGYAIGRIGHIFGGHLKAPHHWIYGLLMIIIGVVFRYDFIGMLILFFGIGLFISDLKDFLILKFYGLDKDVPKRFWHID